MAQNQPAMPETKQHHFLFHVFRMDQENNPMPRGQAESLLQYLKRVFTESTKKDKENN